MRALKDICPLCITLKYDEFERVCETCTEEAVLLKKLYTRIVTERPHLRPYDMPTVFGRMYGRLQELEREKASK